MDKVQCAMQQRTYNVLDGVDDMPENEKYHLALLVTQPSK